MSNKRDFRLLTEEEQEDLDKRDKIFEKAIKSNDNAFTTKNIIQYYDNMPVAIQNHLTLFPNNNIDYSDFFANEFCEPLLSEFENIIQSKTKTESDILNFINTNEANFIIASVMKGLHFNFGHHEAYCFKEFQLGINHRVDYLLVGKNSGGYEFIFVELENPRGSITTADGSFGTTIRKGIKQLNDWDVWLDENYPSLRTVFEKMKNVKKSLPREFTVYDKSRMHFVIVAGQRVDFKDTTYRNKRKFIKNGSFTLLHYDNLLDSTRNLIRDKNLG